ncbi:MAG: RND family efflux transporter MFP subunit [Candidatus Azotimanducaceae bacterium]|jgi:RND family efflux transporter MFP subunit
MAPVALLVAGVGGYALMHWSKPEPEKKDQQPRALSVFVQPVERAEAALDVSAQGEVRAGTQVELISQVAGRVVAVSSEFIEGGVITSGAPLIEIEAIDFQLALAQRQARLAEAEVAVQTALAMAGVARKQLTNASEASDLALRKPQVAEAKARREAAKADLQQARLDLARTKISLPFDGRLISTQVDVGQYVMPGVTLGLAFSTEKVEVRLALSDSQLASLGLPIGYVAGPGGGPGVQLSAIVAGFRHTWKGKMARLDAAIDSNTRMVFGTVEVFAPYTLNRSERGMPLAVGLYVDAEIQGRQVDDAYVIPRDALRAGNKVFVVTDAGELEIREVIVAHSTATEAIVSSGLVLGERVVVSSIRNAIPGMALEALDRLNPATTVAERQPATEAGS